MGVHITGSLTGLDTVLVHGPSGATLRTTPPVDNGGDGSAFSPTDLCAASLGACGATTAALYAKRAGIPLESISFEIVKEMTQAPRRIGRLTVVYRFRTSASYEDYQKLVAAAKACPVRRTLEATVEIDESYEREAP
jgi:putative redox protein